MLANGRWDLIRHLKGLMLGIFNTAKFMETSLKILCDSEGVMRFGTKIFISTSYLYSQILRLHANCA